MLFIVIYIMYVHIMYLIVEHFMFYWMYLIQQYNQFYHLIFKLFCQETKNKYQGNFNIICINSLKYFVYILNIILYFPRHVFFFFFFIFFFYLFLVFFIFFFFLFLKIINKFPISYQSIDSISKCLLADWIVCWLGYSVL